MNGKKLRVAWISYFPVEWLDEAPPEIRSLPKRHPATWLQSCFGELRNRRDLELHIVELSKALPRNVTFNLGNVTFHCVKAPGGLRAPSLFWLDTLLIKRVLQNIRPDVVHAWGTEKGAALVASRLAYPNLISLQGLMSYFAEKLPVSRYERFVAWCERLSMRRARVVSGESKFVTDYLNSHYSHLEVHHVEHSPTWQFFRINRSPQTNLIHFLTVGTIAYRKGTDLLIQALDRLKGEFDFRLTLTGFWSDKALLEDIKSKTSSSIWERISIVDTASNEQVIRLLSCATMVLFPTRADTGPVAVKEAAVAGVPVVGTSMGGIPDYVAQGRNGFLCPPGDLEGLVRAIGAARHHPLIGKGLVEAVSLEKVRKHLEPSKMASEFLTIYRKLAHT